MGAAAGAALLEAANQASTSRKYVNGWEAFAEFCQRAGLCALPAAPETVVRYLGLVKEMGTVAARSLANRLAPINAVHVMADYPSPSRSGLVRCAKRGYRRTYTAAVGGLPEKRGPLPAEVVASFLDLWPSADLDRRNKIAGLTLAFLLFNRPGAASHARAMDVFPTATGLEVQVPDFKMGVLKDSDRLAYTVPVAAGGWQCDRALRIVRSHWRAHRAAGRPPSERLFAPPGATTPLPLQVATSWLRDLLRLVPVRAPVGTKWSGHSLRAGAASEAHALGLSDALIRQLMGLADISTAYRHYIDATWAASSAAWRWFGRYVPTSRPLISGDMATPPRSPPGYAHLSNPGTGLLTGRVPGRPGRQSL